MATTFNSVDPRTGETGPSYEEATTDDVASAVAAASEAHRGGALADRDARAALLRGAAARLRAAGDEIVATAEAETGLPEARLRGELERTAGQLEAFAAVLDAGDYVEAIIDTPDPDAKPIPRPDVRRMLVPIGPVAVFGASNFPLAFSTAGGDTASALAAGVPVVVKGHPSHPGTSELVARELSAAVADAGLPAGTFGHLPAASLEVAQALIDAPAIKAVGFTGSYAGGRAIADRAAARPEPIPVYAEMGSVNPIVVTEAALSRARGRDRRGPDGRRWRTSAASCARSPASSSCPTAARETRSPTTSPRGSTGTEPTVLLNERLRDALREAVRQAGGPRRAARGREGDRRLRGSGISRPPTRPTPATSARPRSCSRSTSARSCCSSATGRATTCWRHSIASRASSPARCTRRTARTSRRSSRRSRAAPAG